MSVRESVRRGVAAYFGGPLDPADPAGSIYRPGPLLPHGLATVRAYAGRPRQPDSDFTAGLEPGAMGARLTVGLTTTTERRVTTGGWKAIVLQTTLGLEVLGTPPHPEVAQAQVDDLLEAIVALVRADPTLGGIVLQAGEGQRGIVTTVAEPLFDGNSARLTITASIAFDADYYLEVPA